VWDDVVMMLRLGFRTIAPLPSGVRACQAHEIEPPPTTTGVVINLSSAVRNSAATLCSDTLGTGGWAAVMGPIRQIHSYEPT